MSTVFMSASLDRSRQRGLTLVELMVTLAIIGILMLVATFAISSTSYAGTVRGFSDKIAAEIDQARLRAVASRKYQRLEVHQDEVELWEADTEGMATPGTYTLIRTVLAPADVQVKYFEDATYIAPDTASVTVGDGFPGYIDFAPDGAGTAATMFVGDANDDSRSRVTVYRATGAVYVFEGW